MARSQRHRLRLQGVTSNGRLRLPKRLTYPTVTGTNTVGQTLTGVDATFAADTRAPVTVSRQWTRTGAKIASATNLTYVLAAPDSGTRVRLVNVATNKFGKRVLRSLPRQIA